MEVPPRPSAPTLGRRNRSRSPLDPDNLYSRGTCTRAYGDYLSTNIPLKPEPKHAPVLSNRGAGAQYNRQAAPAQPQEEQIPLFNNHLSLDCRVPRRLLRQVPHSNSSRDEFSHMRYTAVTCDPADFYDEQYTLRPAIFASPRSTEIMIVLTMYNEDEILFARTLRGVLANIADLTAREGDGPWGKGCWKKVVVCIVSDGRAKLNPRTKALLTLLGVYQDDVAKGTVSGKGVVAHIYEYTTQLRLEMKSGKVKVVPTGALPCQIIFCLKERNQKKVNSHRWALQAFGHILQPKLCTFLDVGTEPGPASIYHLWNAFDKHPTCGGVAAFTKVLPVKSNGVINNPILAAQNFEYNTWNAMDRPFDSLLGLRFDMPTAMFAYRFAALQNDKFGEGPLNEYFRTERANGAEDGLFSANMALTEERALSFALVTKRLCNWDLRYAHKAIATIDVPEISADYVAQRRRWVNGSFFGSVYAISHIWQIFRTSHSASRKGLLFLQCIYQSFALTFTWLSIGNLFLIFHGLTIAIEEIFGFRYVKFADFIYLAMLFLSFVFALAHGYRDSAFLSILVNAWSAIIVFMGAAFVALLFSTSSIIHLIANDKEHTESRRFSALLVPLAVVYGCWLVPALLSGRPGYIFDSIIQYILLLPTRINIVTLYAFCNIHDVSWGTKGNSRAVPLPSVSSRTNGNVSFGIPGEDREDELENIYGQAQQLLKTKENRQTFSVDDIDITFKQFRTLVVAVWALSNGLLVFSILNYIGSPVSLWKGMKFVNIVLWGFAFLTGIKSIGALYYFVTHGKWVGDGHTKSKKRKPT